VTLVPQSFTLSLTSSRMSAAVKFSYGTSRATDDQPKSLSPSW